MGQSDVLRRPENQRFFIWTTGGLKLTGNPPREVVEAWLSIADIPRKRPLLGFLRRARI